MKLGAENGSNFRSVYFQKNGTRRHLCKVAIKVSCHLTDFLRTSAQEKCWMKSGCIAPMETQRQKLSRPAG